MSVHTVSTLIGWNQRTEICQHKQNYLSIFLCLGHNLVSHYFLSQESISFETWCDPG